MAKEALVILVGITADQMKRKYALRYFSRNLPHDVFLPELPQRLGVRWCAWRLNRYLAKTVRAPKYHRVHFLNYISGGAIFRYLYRRRALPNAGRVVYDRGPLQEEVPKALMKRHGRLVLWVAQGKMVTDLAGDWWEQLPFPRTLGEQGLLIEKGGSFLVKSLGITAEKVREEAWDHGRLLPGSADVLEVEESHDDVYTSPRVLAAMCQFLENGRFAPPPFPPPQN